MIKSRRIRWTGYVATVGRSAYRVLTSKPEGKRQLGRSRHRWVDNIEMDLREIGSGDMDWIDMNLYRDQRSVLVKTVMNLRFP
jgi:hypothetical protein